MHTSVAADAAAAAQVIGELTLAACVAPHGLINTFHLQAYSLNLSICSQSIRGCHCSIHTYVQDTPANRVARPQKVSDDNLPCTDILYRPPGFVASSARNNF